MTLENYILHINLPLPPGLNEYINMERKNKYIAAKAKKMYSQLAGVYLRKAKPLPICQYDIIAVWTTASKRKDSDNVFFVKFVLDALVLHQILKDDSYKHVRNIQNIRRIGRNEGVDLHFYKTGEGEGK